MEEAMTDRYEYVDDRTVKDTQHALAGVCYTSFEGFLYISYCDAVKILNRRERELQDSRAAVMELVEVLERVMDGLTTNMIGLDPDVVLDAEALIAKYKIDGEADE
jgi:hypothetical protein